MSLQTYHRGSYKSHQLHSLGALCPTLGIYISIALLSKMSCHVRFISHVNLNFADKFLLSNGIDYIII